MAQRGIEGFTAREVATDHGSVFCHEGGSGPPILLLHGFPETSLMWHGVAPLLAHDFTAVAADLPGYGRSSCPPDGEGHEAMSKRALASTLIEAMNALGHEQFAIIGHDRGGRVAYRAALDHPDRVTAVAVLDVVPTYEVWARADARLALSFWPFSLLAQPAPLPERLLLAALEAVIDNALSEWGSPPDAFPLWLREAYVAALSDPLMCTRFAKNIEPRPESTGNSIVPIWKRAAVSNVHCWHCGATPADWRPGTTMLADR